MAKKSNPALIGTFVVGAVVLIVSSLLLFGSGRWFSDKLKFVMFFDGSVKGLNIGSPVVFRGVRVGAVSDISLHVDSGKFTTIIPVVIEIDPKRIQWIEGDSESKFNRWIDKGFSAQLELQSLVTGQLMVGLDLRPDKEAQFTNYDIGLLEIPTVRTPLQELKDEVERLPLGDIVKRTNNILEGVENIVSSPETLASVAAFQEGLQEFHGLVKDLREGLAPVLENAESTTRGTGELVANLDTRLATLSEQSELAVADLRNLLNNTDERIGGLSEQTGDALTTINTQLGPVMTNLEETSEAAAVAFEEAGRALEAVGGVASGENRVGHELAASMRDLAATARAFRSLAEYLEQHPDALLRGRGTLGGTK